MMHDSILESENKMIRRNNNLLKVNMKWSVLYRQYKSHNWLQESVK